MNKGKTYWASKENLESIKKNAGIGDEINVVDLIQLEDLQSDIALNIKKVPELESQLKEIKDSLSNFEGEITTVAGTKIYLNNDLNYKTEWVPNYNDLINKPDLSMYAEEEELLGLDEKISTAQDDINNIKQDIVDNRESWEKDTTYYADNQTLQLNGTTFSIKDNGISISKLADETLNYINKFGLLNTVWKWDSIPCVVLDGFQDIVLQIKFYIREENLTGDTIKTEFNYLKIAWQENNNLISGGFWQISYKKNKDDSFETANLLSGWTDLKKRIITFVAGDDFQNQNLGNKILLNFMTANGTLFPVTNTPFENDFSYFTSHGAHELKKTFEAEDVAIKADATDALAKAVAALEATDDIKAAYEAADKTLETKINEALQDAKDYADDNDTDTTYDADNKTLQLGENNVFSIANSGVTNAKIAKYDKDNNSGIQLSKLNNSVQYGSGGLNQTYHLCLMQLEEDSSSGVKKLKIYSFDTLRDSGLFMNEE